ncbi:post-GPI attachment to proteins factor 6-like isoform X2 [Anneissia japonica]|uniref:post-GPI attachment to proteins factor 6-like isoform X2 n=1 Tax=Anneissia japonica TaxID=1529436 RepID=UPI0014259830|nr:post-GPI attachment to proteins factor 6-like isoform X2 [Anneissia japonica]
MKGSHSNLYTLMYQEKRLSSYDNYHNTAIFRFPVQSEVKVTYMNFTQIRNDVKCKFVNLTVAVHQGSYPVINPDGSSFPDNTVLRPTVLGEQTMRSNMTLIFDNPNPGYWFLGAYISNNNDRITQKGLGKDCNYRLLVQMLNIHEVDITMLIDSVLVEDSLDDTHNVTMFRYFVPPGVGSFKFIISGCHVKHLDGKINEECPLNITARANALPMNDGYVTCNATRDDSGFNCMIEEQHSETKVWYYLLVQVTEPLLLNKTVQFNVTVQATGCENNKYYLSKEDENDWTTGTSHGYSSPGRHAIRDIMELYLYNVQYDVSGSGMDTGDNLMQCPEIIELEAHDMTTIFSVAYYGSTGNATNIFQISPSKPIITSLDIRSFIDIGGTLKIFASVFEVNDTESVSIILCVQRDRIPSMTSDGRMECLIENELQLNDTDVGGKEWFIPFPEAGSWYIAASAQCSKDNVVYEDCGTDILMEMKVHLTPCIKGCGKYGNCYVSYDAGLSYAYCACKYGYRGWGCTDDSEAWSRTYFLVQVLLLTLSNLFFIPSIILAVYRRFFPEAIVYFCTMFFSTFYHACDSSDYCIMKYDTLQFCDFFSSFMAIFCTLLCMAKLPEHIKQTFTMLAAFGIAIGVDYNRFSLWAALVPTLSGLVILTVSWSYQCRKNKSCYPSKKLWLIRILPGLTLAGVGFLLFALLEKEDNYQYVHSVWHVCMAVGILFLLPSKTSKNDEHEFHMAELMDISTIHAELVENESPDY